MPLAGAAEDQNLLNNDLKTDSNKTVGNNAITNQSIVGMSNEEIVKLQEWLKEKKLNTTSELKIGATGDEVRELQKWLKQNNFYSGEIDGQFGTDTEDAVKKFQKAMGLKEDGSVGAYTLKAMQQWDEYAEKLNSGNTGNAQGKSSSDSDRSNRQVTSSSDRYTTTRTRSTGNNYRSYSRGRGTGDCWDNSAYLYGKLSSSGTQSRIIQYGTSLSSRHRSVQVYKNGRWVDYNYKSNGYAKRYYATKSKPGMHVVK